MRLVHYIALFIIIEHSQLVYGQYDFAEIERLEGVYLNFLEQGAFSEASEVAERLTHAIRIHEGLYSPRQLPYLLQEQENKRLLGDLEDALDKAMQVFWLVSRSENIDDRRRAILANINSYEENECTERHEGGRPKKDSLDCQEERKHLAELFILATKLQEGIARELDSEDEWETLNKMAIATSNVVLWVDGPPTILELEADENGYAFTELQNIQIRERFRHQKWEALAREAGERSEER